MQEEQKPSPLTPEESARVAQVDAGRLAADTAKEKDRLRKKAARKLARDAKQARKAALEMERQEKLKAEWEDSEKARIANDRVRFLIANLTPPIDRSDGNPTDLDYCENYWGFVERDLDAYLVGLEHLPWESLYLTLAMSTVGKLILAYLAIPGLPEIPDGWCYVRVDDDVFACRLPNYVPRVPLYEDRGPLELEVYAKTYDQPPKIQLEVTEETHEYFSNKWKNAAEALHIKTVEQKRVLAEKLKSYEAIYLAYRRERARQGEPE